MKKFTKIIAVVLVLATLSVLFASCGTKLSGDYKGTGLMSGVTYKFSGSKVTLDVNIIVTTFTVEGTYSIKDDKITFDFGDSKDAEQYKGEHSFSKGDGYITIDGIKFEKQ